MRETKVATRYARSLLVLSQERNVAEGVNEDMALIAKTITESKDLSILLKSPIVKTDKKIAIIKAIFSGKLQSVTDSFITLMTQKRREALLGEIAEEYNNQFRSAQGIVRAVVTSAQPLDENIKSQIRAKIDAKGEIEFVEKIDPSLIGGFIVRVGDQQFDGSISRTFSDLKKQFNKNEYIPSF